MINNKKINGWRKVAKIKLPKTSLLLAVIAILLLHLSFSGAFELESGHGVITVQGADNIARGSTITIEVARENTTGTQLTIEINGKIYRQNGRADVPTTFNLTEPGIYRIELVERLTRKLIDYLEISVAENQNQETSTPGENTSSTANETTSPPLSTSPDSNLGAYLRTDKKKYLMGETIIASTNMPQEMPVGLEIYYEVNGIEKKYKGDFSLIVFTPKETGMQSLILKDRSGLIIDQIIFEVVSQLESTPSNSNVESPNGNNSNNTSSGSIGLSESLNETENSTETINSPEINQAPQESIIQDFETPNNSSSYNESGRELTRAQKRLEENKISRQFKSIDSNGRRETINVKLIKQKRENVANLQNRIAQVFGGSQQTEEVYTIEFNPPKRIAEKIKLEGFRLGPGDINFGIEEIHASRANLGGKEIQKAIAVDPEQVDFSNGTITMRAKGRELWKCAEWDFNSQTCFGDWIKIKDIIPGHLYEIEIDQYDPAFAETGLATINTKKSLIHPLDAADLIAVVLDSRGFLVSSANVTITVIAPDNTTYMYTTDEGSVIETGTGIYEARHVHTEFEGNYTIQVLSYYVDLNIAQGVLSNNSMSSTFGVLEFFDFDIIRKMPVTIDPWSGPFKATLDIHPLNENITTYNVTELVPAGVNIIEATGAAIMQQSDNTTRIKWSDLESHSELNYTAQAPLISPNLLVFGKAIIDYVVNGVARVFEEAREWNLAVDPTPTRDKGLVVYSDTTRTLPRGRNWTGSSLLAEQVTGLNFGDNSRWYKFRCMESKPQCLLLASDAGNDLNFAIYHTDTGIWNNLTNLTLNTISEYQSFDVECEDNSGRCLILYENQSTAEQFLRFRIWNGTNITGERLFNFSIGLSRAFRWVQLYPKKNSNIIGIGIQDDAGAADNVVPRIYGAMWNGTNITDMRLINANGREQGDELSYLRNFDCAWAGDGNFSCVSGSNGQSVLNMSTFNGTNWTNRGSIYNGTGTEVGQVAMCGQEPWSTFNHSYLGIMMCDSAEDLDGGIWNGINFSKNISSAVPTASGNAECNDNKPNDAFTQNFECKWENSGDDAVFLWVDNGEDWVSSGEYSYTSQTWSHADWSLGSQISLNGANDIRTTYLTSNAESDKLFLTFSDGGTADGGCAAWSGASWDSSGCNNSAVFESVDTNIDSYRWMVFDYFRSPVQPEIEIIEPFGTNSTKTFFSVISPSTTHKAYNGTTTTDPPAAAAAPVLGTEKTSNGYVNLSTSDNTRIQSTFSGAGGYAYHSFNFSVTESIVSMSSLLFTHEGYAMRGSTPGADSFNIYYYNWSSDTYVLLKSEFASSVDVTSEVTTTSLFTNYVRNRQMLILVQTDTVTAGGAANNRADMYTDYVSLYVQNVALLSSTVRVNATALDDEGISTCHWILINTTNNLTGYIPMINTGAQYYFNRSGLPGVTDGFYNITVQCNDTLGNANNATTRVFIDNTPPGVVLTYPGNAYNSTLNYMNFGWNVTDIAFENMYCNLTLDGSVISANTLSVHGENTTYNKTSIADGTHYWNVTCFDNAGNSNTSETRVFDSDIAGPTVTPLFPAVAQNLNHNPLDINFSATDAHLIVNCSIRLDGAINMTLFNVSNGTTQNFTYSGLSQGVHWWNITCYDSFGYNGNTTGRNFTLDRTAPGIVLNTSNGIVFNGTTPQLNYTATDNIDRNLSCNITVNDAVVDGTANNAPNNTLVARSIPLTDGFKVWNVTCADDSGNYNTSVSRSFNVIGGPVVNLFAPSNASYNNGVNVNFTFNASDGNGVANCTLYINDIANQTSTSINNYANTTITTNLSEGRHNWNVTCYDTGGSIGYSVVRLVFADKTPPAMSLSAPTNGQVVASSAYKFNFTLTDTISPNATCNLTVDGTVASGNTNFIATNNTLTSRNFSVVNGLHWWNVTCYDLGGNANVSANFNFTLNITVAINVSVIANKDSYQEGEIAIVNTTTRNDTSGLTATNITLDFIYTNRTFTDVPWWNVSWQKRKPIVINESQSLARTGKPVMVNVTVPYLSISSCANEIRVVEDSTLTPVPFNLIIGDDVTYCTIIFNATVSASASNENNYHVYYNFTGAPNPGYTNISVYQIFFDNFNDGNIAGWTSAGWDTGATPMGGTHAHDNGVVSNSAITLTTALDSSSYDIVNITFSYMIEGNTEAGDFLAFDFSHNSGTAWTQNISVVEGGTATEGVNTAFGQSLNSTFRSSGFSIRFRYTADNANEDAGFDNINITGYNAIAQNITASVGAEQMFISRIINVTNATGRHQTNFTTLGRTYGNYTAVVRALSNSARTSAGTGYDWYNIIPDSFGPVITILYPANLTTLTPRIVTFNFTANDFANSVLNCSLYINNEINQTNTTITESANTSFSVNLTEGRYDWAIQCFDTLTSNTTAGNYILFIDNTGPVVYGISPNATTLSTGVITFTYNATDNFDTNIFCNLTMDGGNFPNRTNTTTSANASLGTTYLSVAAGAHYWNVTCYDNVNNTGYSTILNFTAADRPILALHAPPNASGFNSTNITLQYNLSSSNIANCTLYVNSTILQIANTSDIPFTSNNGPNEFNITSIALGIYNWTVNCYDTNNFNDSDPTRVFHIDDAAPNITLNYPLNQSTIFTRTVRFNFTTIDTDDLLVCNLTLDGAVNSSNTPVGTGRQTLINATNVAIGNHSWRINCYDNVGFQTISDTYNFTIIANASVTLVSPANNTIDNDGSVSFSFTPSSTAGFSLGYCSVYIDAVEQNPPVVAPNSDQTYISTHNGIAQGYHSWYVNCTDNAGLVSVSQFRNFTVDTTAPVVTALSPNATLFTTTAIFFNWTAADNLSPNMTCTIRVNGSAQSPTVVMNNGTIANNTYTGFGDGLFVWNSTCMDWGGLNGTSSQLNFTVAVVPGITLNFPLEGNRTRFRNLTFRATPTDNSGTITNCTLILDGVRNETNLTSSSSGTQKSIYSFNLYEGTHNWTVNCSDPSGNTNQSATVRNFTIDLTAPNMTILYPTEGAAVNSNNVTFSWNATDAVGITVSCQLFVDGIYNRTVTSLSGANASTVVNNRTEGSHNWSINCSDDLGNYNSSATYNFTINSADLHTNNSMVWINTSNPNLYEQIRLFANVTNVGGVAATNVLIEFWDGPPVSGTFIGNVTGTVPGSGINMFNVTWNITPGYHTIWVVLDRYDLVAELNESDNNASMNISVLWANITEPANTTILNTSNVNINFTVTDYSGQDINYTVLVDGAIHGQSALVSDGFTTSFNATILEGVKRIVIQARDSLNRYKNSSTIFITVDFTPPLPTINTVNQTRFNYTTPAINITITDNTDTLINFTVFVNGTFEFNGVIQNNTQGIVNLTGRPDGAYLITVQGTDNANNTRNGTSKTIYIDTTAPTVTIYYPTEGAAVNTNNVPFSWNATDYAGTTISCQLFIDGVYNTTVSGVSGSNFTTNVSNLAQGAHNWSLNCSDNIGNYAMGNTYNFTINAADLFINTSRIVFNNTNPSLYEQISITANVTNTGGVPGINVLVEFWDGAPVSGIFIANATVNVTGNNHTIVTTPWNITPGYHTIWVVLDRYNLTYEISDDNNNASRNISVLWANITEPANASIINSNNISINFTTTDYSGQNINYTILVDGAIHGQSALVPDGSTTAFNFTNLAQGLRRITIQARDSLNRYKNSTHVFVIIDSIAPSVTINTINNTWFNSSTPGINITSSDAVDAIINYTLFVNGTPHLNGLIANTTQAIVNLSALPDGLYELILQGMDEANNTRNSTPKIIYIDTTSPFIVIIGPENNSNFTAANMTFTYTAFDNLANYLICNVTLDGVVQSATNRTNGAIRNFNVTGLFEGPHYWNVTCIDQAYNLNVSENRVFNIFKAPSITLSSPANRTVTANTTIFLLFNATDDTGLENCTLILNGVLNETKTSGQLTNGGLSNFTLTNLNGTYTWAVTCYDNTSLRVQNTSVTWQFTVDIDYPVPTIITANQTWYRTQNPQILFNITDNYDTNLSYVVFVNGALNTTGFVANASLGNATLLGITPDGAYLIVVQGTDDAGNSANSSSITIYIDTTAPSINLSYPPNGININATHSQFNFTPSDFMSNYLICNLSISGGFSTLNLNITNNTLQNINKTNFPSGLYYWNVSCYDIAGNSNTSENRNFTISAPDLIITSSNITFNESTYEESVNITVYANVFNIGGIAANNITVQFWRGNPTSGGTQVFANITIATLASFENMTVNITYTPIIGVNNIFVAVDPQTTLNGTITEENESNNLANKTFEVGQYQIFAGNLSGIIEIEKQSINRSLYNWSIGDTNGSYIFVSDTGLNINFYRLQALGKNTTNGTTAATTNDFTDLDNKIATTNLSDSINRTYTLLETPKETMNLTIFERNILDIPVVNSTNSTAFKTGILWDASDGGVAYNGTQDILFVAPINQGALGSRGAYDFEIAVPAYLRNYNAAGTSVAFYVELK